MNEFIKFVTLLTRFSNIHITSIIVPIHNIRVILVFFSFETSAKQTQEFDYISCGVLCDPVEYRFVEPEIGLSAPLRYVLQVSLKKFKK